MNTYHKAKASLYHRWAEEKRQAEEAQRQAVAEAQRQEQAAARLQAVTSNLEQIIQGESDMNNDDVIAGIVNRYAEQARGEIERELAKSEAQQKLEAATRRQHEISLEYAHLAKNASQNAPRLKELHTTLKELDGEISVHTSALEFQQAQAQRAALEEEERNAVQKSFEPKGIQAMPNRR